MKKKILAVCLCVAMLAIAIVGGTLAYFTDAKAETNVFTVGNVKIELIESYVHRGADTGYEEVAGYPEASGGNHSDDQIVAGSGDAYKAYLAGQQLTPGVSINKMPYVKNVGTTDAWVRIHVMIPAALDTVHLNSSVICTTALDEEFVRPDGVGKYGYTEEAVDGVAYHVYTFIRQEALESGDMTTWNVWNTIRMDESTTSEQIEALIASGAITGRGEFNVLVKAEAIQATGGLNTPELAWAAFDSQVNP